MAAVEFKNQSYLAYATSEPTVLVTLKQQPEDFKVDEELGFEPTGSGDHVFLKVRKRNYSTTEVARKISTAFGVKNRDVSYAGMKDRRAVTTQWFSAKLPQGENSPIDDYIQTGESDIEVLESLRNKSRLKIGSHRRNRFQLVLKEFAGEKSELEGKLKQISQNGFPNYYGNQRFGKNLSNLTQVQALFHSHSEPKQPRKPKRVGMLYSAARAYLFNQILSERIQQGAWNQYLPGDVLNLDSTTRFFDVDENQWDQTLEDRLQTLDVHPTGLLCGASENQDSYVTRAQAADIEDAVVASYPSLAEGLKRHGLQAGRRALRCKVSDLQWHWQDGQTLALSFGLPKGAYATSFLREICQIRAH